MVFGYGTVEILTVTTSQMGPVFRTLENAGDLEDWMFVYFEVANDYLTLSVSHLRLSSLLVWVLDGILGAIVRNSANLKMIVKLRRSWKGENG